MSEEKFVCNPGSPIAPVYQSRYDEKGDIVVEEVGKENLYDYIQSFKDSCDVNYLVKRYAAGDVDVLSRVQGVYADVTKMPKTLAESVQLQIDAERGFESLPADIKQKFDNNFVKFAAAAGSAEWFEKLGFEKKDVVKEEVKPVEP